MSEMYVPVRCPNCSNVRVAPCIWCGQESFYQPASDAPEDWQMGCGCKIVGLNGPYPHPNTWQGVKDAHPEIVMGDPPKGGFYSIAAAPTPLDEAETLTRGMKAIGLLWHGPTPPIGFTGLASAVPTTWGWALSRWLRNQKP